MKPDVLVLHPPRPKAMAALEAAYRLHRYDLSEDKDALLDIAGPRCAAAVTDGHIHVDQALIDRLPALKVISSASAGYDAIDVAALTKRGIVLTNSSPALMDDVADAAIMLMLAARRGLPQGDAYVRSGAWAREGGFPLRQASAGKRLGIVGLGQIGKAVARRAESMNMTIAYHGRREQPNVAYPYYANLVALAQDSDVLIVAAPGGAETQGMISAEIIHALGPEGTLVNVGRGSVVDETALIDALQSGALGAAGLDVFWDEPRVNPAFAALENVALYPHHASGTVESRDAMAMTIVDNLAAHYAGAPLLTPVNAPVR